MQGHPRKEVIDTGLNRGGRVPVNHRQFGDIYLRHPVRVPYSLVCRHLGHLLPVSREALRSIAVAEDMAENLFIPCAGSGIAANEEVKMISVTGHVVTDK